VTYSPLTIKRKQVLGDLYGRCAPVESIPVFLNEDSEPVGHMDESVGRYMDAFSFHLPEDICKKLCTSHYQIGFDYDVAEGEQVRLNHILLIAKVIPPRAKRSKAGLEAVIE
jgi:hypothetical protein